MPKLLTLRPLTGEEEAAVDRLARSRNAPARAVERARIVWLANRGQCVPAIAREVGVSAATVRFWLKRFNTHGLDGLTDAACSGRPPTYTPEEVGAVVAARLTKPDDLGLPFASWTLDRLEAYLDEEQGIPIKSSRIAEILADEGLRWRQQETWFGERPDPAFSEKRGDRRPLQRPAAGWGDGVSGRDGARVGQELPGTPAGSHRPDRRARAQAT